MTWPDGWDGQFRLDGRARDAVTVVSPGAPVVVATATSSVGIGAGRTIEDITADPTPPRLAELVGCRGGGYLRAALATVVPQELAAGTPLYLLLDDISGASLIAGFAWSRWNPNWMKRGNDQPRPSMEGVCIGFRPGSVALTEQREGGMTHRVRKVGPLLHPDDPDGWHTLADLPDVSMRRARRIDVWRDTDGLIRIDSGFQDSAGDPDHGRIAIHEYVLRATADPDTMTLLTVEPEAHILPFVECPAAVQTAQAVVGTALRDLRATVLERLARTNGCTHLNDALRALAEVPMLLAQLDATIT
jgi:hypothetical protein